MCKKDEKTVRKWSWLLMCITASQDWVHAIIFCSFNWHVSDSVAFCAAAQIVWEERLLLDNGSVCKISLDGVDFPVNEPSPFDEKWHSHKFKGPGLRHEVGVCIQTGLIVWVNGPHPCSSHPDIVIARQSIVHELDVAGGEMTLADGGHNNGCQFFKTPTGINDADQRMKAIVRARHETVNRRLKTWGTLKKAFRHSVAKHGITFCACANVTQMTLECDWQFGHQFNDNLPVASMFMADHHDLRSKLLSHPSQTMPVTKVILRCSFWAC